MAVDNDIPVGSPGAANYASETWGNIPEHLFSDTPPVAEVTMDFTASGGSALEISFLDVLAADGTAAEEDGSTAEDRANFIAAATTTIADGETKSVPVYVAGHFNMQALNWDSTYDTDAKKKAAFQGSLSPTILVSKSKHESGAIYT